MRKNPRVDLTASRTTPIASDFIPLDKMSVEDFLVLPVEAFTKEEWKSLSPRMRDVIELREAARVRLIHQIFRYMYNQVEDPNSYASDFEAKFIEDFEDYLNDLVAADDIAATYKIKYPQIVTEWRETFEQRYSYEQFNEALKEAGGNQNNYDLFFADWAGEDPSDFDKGIFWWEAVAIQPRLQAYEWKRWIEEHLRGEGKGDVKSYGEDLDVVFYPSDFERALEEVRGEEKEFVEQVFDVARMAVKGFEYRNFRRLLAFLNQIGSCTPPIRSNWVFTLNMKDALEPEHVFTATPDWRKIEAQIADTLQGEPELGVEVEEDVVYEFPSGFYVADLKPQELALEGRKQGICVGQSEYGYAQAIEDGDIKIFSLRRPSGKPLLTFEIATGKNPVYELAQVIQDPGATFSEILQIKGKGNRLPGWDRGKAGQGKVKENEVRLAREFLENYLGLNVWQSARYSPNISENDLIPGLLAVYPEDLDPEVTHRLKTLYGIENPARKTFSDPAGPV